jgi:hypothetical protein
MPCGPSWHCGSYRLGGVDFSLSDLYFRMTLNSFKHWLRLTTSSLQEYEADPQEIDCIVAATILAEARRQAVELCLPEVARLCVRSDESFPVGRAIKILAECLQLLDSLAGPLTVKQAAKRMTISQRQVSTR